MKKKLKIGSWLVRWGLYFNIAETILFQFIYGWHWTATHFIEKLCDKIAGLTMDLGIVALFLACIDATEYCIAMEEAIHKALNKEDRKEALPND
jgi:hypothetical protein